MWLLLSLLACKKPLEVVARDPSDRTPISGSCDDLDPSRCLLPWPSSRFVKVDPTTETGLRVSVDPTSLPVNDDVSYLNTADGFSRISGVATEFDGAIDAASVSWDPAANKGTDAPLQIFDAQPGSTRYAQRVALRTEIDDGNDLAVDRHLLIGRPAEVMEANADHVAVVLDTIGSDQPIPRLTEVALQLVAPETDEEAYLQGYYAPDLKLIQSVGIDPHHVVRMWDFTTRSAGDATYQLHSIINGQQQAVGDLGIEIDSALPGTDPGVGLVMRGRLTGAPGYTDAAGHLVLDANGDPTVVGTTDIEFRLMIPAGTGDYRVAMYGHGTGGDVSDPAFDTELGSAGIAKLAIRFTGWTGDDFVETLLSFTTFLEGSERSTAGLMQALAGGSVLLTSLDGLLGDTVSADTLAGAPNPVAGRHPKTDKLAWVGGSMGGTMGAVMTSADPRLSAGVLNVPGSGWTHMIPGSLLYSSGMNTVFATSYHDPIDVQLAMVMGQNNWDEVDGAVWADEALANGGTFLLQESIGDPVLPNIGTELLANSLGAKQFIPALSPVVGLEQTSHDVTSGAALEQFKVPDTGAYDVHGFAARETPAGLAARLEIVGFLTSYWDGAPVMSPTDCEGSAVAEIGRAHV